MSDFLQIVESKDNLVSIAVSQVETRTAIEGDRMVLCRFFHFMLKLQDMKTDELRHDTRVTQLIALSFVVGMIDSPQFLLTRANVFSYNSDTYRIYPNKIWLRCVIMILSSTDVIWCMYPDISPHLALHGFLTIKIKVICRIAMVFPCVGYYGLGTITAVGTTARL